MKKLTIHLLICSSFLIGCSSNEVTESYVTIDGVRFLRDSDGVLMLSKDDVEVLKGNKDIVIVERVLGDGSIAITEEELHLLSKDEQLFEETVEKEVKANEIFTFLLKKGSLKSNLQRLSDKYSTSDDSIQLDYQLDDLYVAESKVIRAESIEEITALIISEFDSLSAVIEPVKQSMEDQ